MQRNRTKGIRLNKYVKKFPWQNHWTLKLLKYLRSRYWSCYGLLWGQCDFHNSLLLWPVLVFKLQTWCIRRIGYISHCLNVRVVLENIKTIQNRKPDSGILFFSSISMLKKTESAHSSDFGVSCLWEISVHNSRWPRRHQKNDETHTEEKGLLPPR